MSEEDELVRLIEKLGDDLGDIITLSKSIYDTIKQKYGINGNTLGIWKLYIHSFQSAGKAYKQIKGDFFKELQEAKQKE